MKLMKEKYETRRPTSRCVDVGACFNVTGERTLLMKSKNERVGCLLSTLKDGPHEPSQSHGFCRLCRLSVSYTWIWPEVSKCHAACCHWLGTGLNPTWHLFLDQLLHHVGIRNGLQPNVCCLVFLFFLLENCKLEKRDGSTGDEAFSLMLLPWELVFIVIFISRLP